MATAHFCSTVNLVAIHLPHFFFFRWNWLAPANGFPFFVFGFCRPFVASRLERNFLAKRAGFFVVNLHGKRGTESQSLRIVRQHAWGVSVNGAVTYSGKASSAIFVSSLYSPHSCTGVGACNITCIASCFLFSSSLWCGASTSNDLQRHQAQPHYVGIWPIHGTGHVGRWRHGITT
jgi:hypothetical protein